MGTSTKETQTAARVSRSSARLLRNPHRGAFDAEGRVTLETDRASYAEAMSKAHGVLRLVVPREIALSACHAALTAMDWHVIGESPDGLDAREDPVRLCCHQSPAESQLRISELEHGSAIAIETRVPGFGPVPSVHANECQLSLVRHVHKYASGVRAQPR